jgi:hypothetical protein
MNAVVLLALWILVIGGGLPTQTQRVLEGQFPWWHSRLFGLASSFIEFLCGLGQGCASRCISSFLARRRLAASRNHAPAGGCSSPVPSRCDCGQGHQHLPQNRLTAVCSERRPCPDKAGIRTQRWKASRGGNCLQFAALRAGHSDPRPTSSDVVLSLISRS